MQIKLTNEQKPRPRFLIYGDPGDGKTSLCSTLATGDEKDILFAFTEGGMQSVSHLALPYMEINRVEQWDELISFFKNGKRHPDGIVVNGHLYRGVIVDLFSEYVQMCLLDMLSKASSVLEGKRSIDDPSEYEYKKLNFRIIRQLRELRNLPLKYVGFTAYVQEYKDPQGNVTRVLPQFVGTKIWTSVCGSVDYVFRVSPPLNAKDKSEYRLIRTQPSQIHYAKSRLPGVAGKLPLPAEVKYKLGHPTALTSIFDLVEQYIVGNRKLEATQPIPVGVEEVSAAEASLT